VSTLHVRALKLAKENHANEVEDPRRNAKLRDCLRSSRPSRTAEPMVLKAIAPNIDPGRFLHTVEPNTTIDSPVPTTYSAAIGPPWKPLAMRSPIAWSILRQYSIARANTRSVTRSLRWPTTFETSRSSWALSMTLRTRVPA
jgi:hypothetical protein